MSKRMFYVTDTGEVTSIKLPKNFYRYMEVQECRSFLIKDLPESGVISSSINLDFYSKNPKKSRVSRRECIEMVKSLLLSDRNIQAIKIMREFDPSLNLRDAKMFVDIWQIKWKAKIKK